MPTFLYIGTDRRDFPGDGTRPSFTVEPGGQVDADTNPDPRYFDSTETGPADPPAATPEV